MKKKVSKKQLGIIYSSGGNHVNTDYFHIYSEKALFDYDTVRSMNLYAVSQNKKDIYNLSGGYNLKKKNFNSSYVSLDDWGSHIIIMKLKVPNFGEGIACIHTFDFWNTDIKWFNSTFINSFIDFNHYGEKINIVDRKISFAFFNPVEILDFFDLNDFFKKKSKQNVIKFNNFILDRFKKINEKIEGRDEHVFSYKVPNGKYKIYGMICNYDFKGSVIKKDMTVGSFIKLKWLGLGDERTNQ